MGCVAAFLKLFWRRLTESFLSPLDFEAEPVDPFVGRAVSKHWLRISCSCSARRLYSAFSIPGKDFHLLEINSCSAANCVGFN